MYTFLKCNIISVSNALIINIIMQSDLNILKMQMAYQKMFLVVFVLSYIEG